MSARVLNRSQLEQAWIRNGGAPAAAPMAAAIALAESGGRTDATNHNTNGSTDRGAWQINSVHGALSTYDLDANAKAAIKISSNGLNWQPWSTYQNGAFRRFLTGATRPASTSSTPGTRPAAPAPAAGTDLFSDKATGLKYAVVWIAIVIGGVALAGMGINHALGGAPARGARRVGKTAATAAAAA
ncbi:MAG: hypothetical protein ACJ768_09375 [Gaiellaceae bacterium]